MRNGFISRRRNASAQKLGWMNRLLFHAAILSRHPGPPYFATLPFSNIAISVYGRSIAAPHVR
jgi:hypothetical protein